MMNVRLVENDIAQPAKADLPAEAVARRRLHVSGVVQGVGFRPFLYNLAYRLGLGGWARNSSTGIEIEVQGSIGALDHFLDELRYHAPPLACVLAVESMP